MMKTLLINAQPDFKNDAHYSVQLQNLFLDRFNAKFPNETVDLINLYDMSIPRLTTTELLGIWGKQAQNVELNATETKFYQQNQALLQQFKAHHRIVIASPLHNFNITSKLKDYMDNILVARETFKYTTEGSVGLMTDDYKALLLQASGSIYTNQDRYTPLEFSRMYLEGMFQEIMGFADFDIVRAQGLQTHGVDVEAAMTQAKADLNVAFDRFYN